jgi:hypothetical protein
VHVARDWVEWVEGDNIADLGAKIIDLADQANGPGHSRQRNRNDSKEDGACTAGVSVFCAHRPGPPAACQADYRRRWFIIDEVIWQKQLVQSRIQIKKAAPKRRQGYGEESKREAGAGRTRQPHAR